MRSKLVLPLPFGPVSWTKVPGESERSRPLNSRRSPRTQPSLLTSNIFDFPPRPFYWRNLILTTAARSFVAGISSLCALCFSVFSYSQEKPPRHRGTEKRVDSRALPPPNSSRAAALDR